MLLNQNSTNDFSKQISGDLKIELRCKDSNEYYYFWKDVDDTVYSLSIGEYGELQELQLTL